MPKRQYYIWQTIRKDTGKVVSENLKDSRKEGWALIPHFVHKRVRVTKQHYDDVVKMWDAVIRDNPKSKAKKSSASLYLYRPSIATRKKPSKRLIVRRKKTLAAPKGVFANPVKKVRLRVEIFQDGKWNPAEIFEVPFHAEKYWQKIAKDNAHNLANFYKTQARVIKE